MPSGSAGTAVIEAGEGSENPVPDTFRHTRAVVFDIDPATLRPKLVTEADLRLGMAHGIAHQVL
ncbi:hypothetical protein D3C80_1570530 [compost metagenome]